jgi:hypothetical protein
MNMRLRSVLREFEAHFHPVQAGSNVHGKSEWKHYGNGTYRFKISIRNISLPDGSQVDILCDGIWIVQLSVQNHKARLDLENDNGAGVLSITAGQVLQVRSGDTILAEGTYREE